MAGEIELLFKLRGRLVAELEALHARIAGVDMAIEILRSEAPAPRAVLALPAPDDASAPKRPRGRPKAKKPKARAPAAKGGGVPILDRVLAAIEAAGPNGITRAEVVTATKLAPQQVSVAARDLLDGKRIDRVGHARALRYIASKFSRGSSAAERRPHKPKVGGANPSPATKPDAAGRSEADGAGAGGNGSERLPVAADRPTSNVSDAFGETSARGLVHMALQEAAGVGLSKSALKARTGLDDAKLDEGLSACLRKRQAVERDRVFYAK